LAPQLVQQEPSRGGREAISLRISSLSTLEQRPTLQRWGAAVEHKHRANVVE